VDDSIFRPLHQPSCTTTCSTCNLREICLPVGLNKLELEYLDRHMVTSRRKVARGATLYQAGAPFESLYAVWTGFFKTSVSARDGRDQVTGFQMGGEMLGLDGIATRRHEVDAVALEDSQVCVMPFEALESLAQEVGSLQQQLHRVLSREIVRHQGVMLLLGSMYAEERLAAFLLNLTQRLHARGFSGSQLLLRMTREEIGSFLGLTLETVSRTFSKFQADGLLHVRNRQIRITDPLGLQQVVDGTA
jgi:CRP/FNR family transcriptional regulator, anaerobic regulatory protein